MHLQLKAAHWTLLLLMSACAAASSETNRNVEVPAGQTSRVAMAARWDNSCRATDLPDVRIIEGPAHGTVDVRRSMNTVTNVRMGSTSCIGKEVDGTAIFYTPSQGYTGSDQMRYRANFGTLGIEAYNLSIRVK